MASSRLLCLSCLLAAALPAFGQDDPDSLKLAQTPPAVQKKIAAEVNDGKLVDIDKEHEGGEDTYDVSFTTKAGVEHDFTVADDGTLLSIEVGLSETPVAVQKTILAQQGAWQLESIDRNVDAPDVSFDVKVTKDALTRSFTVGIAGDLQSEEVALGDTPAAVQATIKTQMGGNTLDTIYQNIFAAGSSWDVSVVLKDGSTTSFTVGTNGKLLSEQVALEAVPQAAHDTIMERIGAGKVLHVERSHAKKLGVFPFEVQGRKDGKPFDFSVGPKGRFLGMDD